MTTGKSIYEEIYQYQRENPEHETPLDVDVLFQMNIKREIVIEEFKSLPAFETIFKYWYHNFDGDYGFTFDALIQLIRCAVTIRVFANDAVTSFKDVCEYHYAENRTYLEAYKHLEQASELLDIPMRIMTLVSDFPTSLEEIDKRVKVPTPHAISRMLEAVERQNMYEDLQSAVTSSRSTRATWAIRYLWKNINIEPQHMIEGHLMLGDRWKLIESLLDSLGDFIMDQNQVRLTLSRNLPAPSLLKKRRTVADFDLEIEEWDRAFFE